MASSGKGLPFIGKMGEFLDRVLHPTVNKTGNSKASIDVRNIGYYKHNAVPLVVEAGSTNNVVKLTGHNAVPGDLFRLRTTANGVKEYDVVVDEVIDADNFKLAGYLSASLAAGDTFDLYKPTYERFTSDGASLASVDSPPVKYNRKVGGVTVPTEVTQDQDTPSLSRPFPVVLHGLDAANITVTSNDLNIASSHVNDSVAIGNGVDKIVGVTTSNELKVNDAQLAKDTNGWFPTSLHGVVDTGNSRDTILGANITFTGVWKDITNFAAISIGIVTDVDSAVNGIKFQFSSDGVNVHHEHTFTYISGGYGVGYNVPVEYRYFRVQYVNGGSAQNVFHFISTLKQVPLFPSSYKLIEPITGQTQALFTRGVIVGETTGGGGGYVNVKVNPSGAMVTEATLSASVGTRIGTVAIDQTTPGTTNAVSVTNFPATQNITGAVTVTSGSISVSNFPATQAVTGTFWQATQPVSSVDLGEKADASATSDTGTFSLIALFKRLLERFELLKQQLPASLGIKTGAASLSVVPASDAVFVTSPKSESAGVISSNRITLTTAGTQYRATVSGVAPVNRKKIIIKPNKDNLGSVWIGNSSVSTTTGVEFIGPDRMEFLNDNNDYYLVSDQNGTIVEILEVY